MTGSTDRLPSRVTHTNRSLLKRIYDARYLYLLIAPTFALTILFIYYPTVSGLYHSFFDWNGVTSKYVGLANFREFFSDPWIKISILNLVKIILFSLFTVLTSPLIVAVVMFHLRSTRLQYWYRVGFVLPMVVPGVVTLLLWIWFYDMNGLVNGILRAVGMGQFVIPWLGNPRTALYAVLFIGFPWVGAVNMLIYLAGLQGIPKEILDAAIVDGATTLRRVFAIELPLIMGQIKLLVILTLIGSIQGFQQFLIVTDGGPGHATMVPGLRLYAAAMVEQRLGYASAIGLIMFVVIFALTIVNMKYIRSSAQYY